MSFIYNTYEPTSRLLWGIASESLFNTIAFGFFIFIVIKLFGQEKIKMKTKDMVLFFFSAIFGALAGGRLWFYVTNWNGITTIIDIFNLSKAGLTSFGMILGGIIGLLIFVHFHQKKNFRKTAGKYFDILAIATALYIFIYRMGCFHFGDVPGTVTKLPWGVFAINYGKYTGKIMHPTALYLSFLALIIFLFLNWYKDKKKYDGEVGLIFLGIYSLSRFFLEFFRAGTIKYMGLSDGQWILAGIFLVSAFFFWKYRN